MRTLLPLMLIGCIDAGNPFPTGGPINPQDGCSPAGAEYIQANAGNLTTLQFLIDQQAVLIDVNSITTCVRSDGAGAAWLFDRNGTSLGMFRVESPNTGAVSPTGTNFVLDLNGDSLVPVRFTGNEFDGSFQVNSLDPFTVSINGTASLNNRTAIINFNATATP